MPELCTSDDGEGGTDCFAPPEWGEHCSCQEGRALVLGVHEWEGTQLYEYTCCVDVGPTSAYHDAVGDTCGSRHLEPTGIVILVVLAVLLYLASMTFMYRWNQRAKDRAAGVPTQGWAPGGPNTIAHGPKEVHVKWKNLRNVSFF